MDIKVLFTTDFNHSHSSKVIIGIYTDIDKLHDDCKEIITKDIKNNTDLTDEDDINESLNETLEFLKGNNQTQSLNEFELVIEDWVSDKYEL